jgi:hypothetical protein
MRRYAVSLLTIGLLLACAETSPPADAGETGETGEGPGPCEIDDDCEADGLCLSGTCMTVDGRRPYRDDWREELVLPAAQFERLIIGGTIVMDNFANRGDIEIRYVAGSSEIVVEMQRFTVAQNSEDSEAGFARMKSWAYSLETPEAPDDEIADAACELGGADFCHVRSWYEGQIQPVRDGVNIRVTLPVGWAGELELETEDNLQESEYPDRGDVLVDGLAGPLQVVLDSGRVELRLASSYPHFPGCALDEACVAAEFAPDCGCSEFARIGVTARVGEAAELLVDVPADHTYAVELQNADPGLELGCTVEIDCDGFPECVLDPDTVGDPAVARAAINHPGDPAILGAGIDIELHSGACSMIDHAEQPSDWISGPAADLRGSVRLCSGCW